MAHIFFFNADYYWHKEGLHFDLEVLGRMAPSYKINRAEEAKAIEQINRYARIDILGRTISVYVEDDSEAVALMMSMTELIMKPESTKLVLILENPDWNDILSNIGEIQGLEASANAAVRQIDNAWVPSAKRKFKKFRADMENAVRSFSAEFGQEFQKFEELFDKEMAAYSKSKRDVKKDLESAKNALRRRFQKYVVKKVTRRR
jgi:hypothetical protein